MFLCLVVPGQCDELISVLKYLMHALKSNVDYWKLTPTRRNHSLADCEHFLDMVSCTTRWRGEEIPEKIHLQVQAERCFGRTGFYPNVGR